MIPPTVKLALILNFNRCVPAPKLETGCIFTTAKLVVEKAYIYNVLGEEFELED